MKKMLLLSLCSIVLLFACTQPEDDDPGNPSPNNTCTNPVVVTVGSDFDFSQPVTFKACTVYYFTAGVDIKSTLTIEAGAILKFKDIYTWSGLMLTNNATGRVIAKGTADKPIIFTSERDDAHGGDTNGDGNATVPEQGDWNGIYITGTGSVFEYCKFLYGGQNGYSMVELFGVDPKFNYCTFAYSGGSASLTGKGVFHFGSNTSGARVTNSWFYGNVKPITMNSNTSMDASNVFHNPSKPSEKNVYNGIFVEQSSNQVNISWLENEVPFVYMGTSSNQGLGTNFDAWTFTLGPGVIIKFASIGTGAPGIWVRSDNSEIVGKDAGGVFFTSYADDAHGGDTNADGNATSPAQGDWDGVYDPAAQVNPPDYYYSWGNILYAAN